MRAPLRLLAALLASAAAVTGCGFKGAASLPLPGGVATGDDAYELQVEFDDVLDLVPASSVRVDDVAVGTVSEIDLDGYTALVTVRVREDVVLPANARASIRQTSLLGEKYVSLDRPRGVQGSARLGDGDLIPLERTRRGVEVEEVLAAFSLVINGGSIEQLQVINRELATALRGREDAVRSVLSRLEEFVGGLDAQKDQIIRALEAVDRLATRFARERQVIATALEDLPGGATVLADQRADLTRVLTGLNRLGDVASRVIRSSQQATVADLQALEPVLRNLAAAGSDLPRSLEMLTTYPFPRTVTEGIKGDYANLFITLDINLQGAAENMGIVPRGGAAPRSQPSRPALPPAGADPLGDLMLRGLR